MMIPRILVILSILAECGCAGKSEGVADVGHDDGTDSTQNEDQNRDPRVFIRRPFNSREVESVCDQPRPIGLVTVPGECTNDSECTAGLSGRCLEVEGTATCTYDSCESDSDCGGACFCGDRNDAVYYLNVCVPAECNTSADCAPYFCKPNTDICAFTTIGYHCTTGDDTCVNDSDCPDGDVCRFERDHWACEAIATCD